jgi:signal transduction histidine kinase
MKRTKPQSPGILQDADFSQFLLENLTQSALLLVDKAGRITYVTKSLVRLFGLSQNKLLEQVFFQVVHLRDDRNNELTERKHPVFQALRTRSFNQMTPFFCRLETAKGQVPVALRAIQIKQQARVSGVIVELREVKRVLNVGEMKTLFVSFAAHQLKTPSSIVKGFLELMLREGKRAYQSQQWYNLQSAFEANENLIHLSKTLLNLTRLEGGLIEPKLAPFDPEDVLRRKIASHQSLLKIKNVKVDLRVEGKSRPFLSDEVFFSEVYEVLFNNALKYSDPGSRILVICKPRKEELTVEVHDEGPGIPEDKQQTLFKGASDMDPEKDSHGIGLLMAKKYVSLLKGDIGMRPGVVKGSVFFFTIPKP